jgi:hypothetical protein
LNTPSEGRLNIFSIINVKEATMDIRNAVEKKAYELFENNGCICGFDVDHWLEAERIIYAGFPPAASDKSPAKIKAAPIKAAQDKNEPLKMSATKAETKTANTIKRAAKKIKDK